MGVSFSGKIVVLIVITVLITSISLLIPAYYQLGSKTDGAGGFMTTMILVSAVIAAALGGAGFFLAKTLTKPIRKVTETLRESFEQISSASGQVSVSSQHLARTPAIRPHRSSTYQGPCRKFPN